MLLACQTIVLCPQYNTTFSGYCWLTEMGGVEGFALQEAFVLLLVRAAKPPAREAKEKFLGGQRPPHPQLASLPAVSPPVGAAGTLIGAGRTPRRRATCALLLEPSAINVSRCSRCPGSPRRGTRCVSRSRPAAPGAGCWSGGRASRRRVPWPPASPRRCGGYRRLGARSSRAAARNRRRRPRASGYGRCARCYRSEPERRRPWGDAQRAPGLPKPLHRVGPVIEFSLPFEGNERGDCMGRNDATTLLKPGFSRAISIPTRVGRSGGRSPPDSILSGGARGGFAAPGTPTE